MAAALVVARESVKGLVEADGRKSFCSSRRFWTIRRETLAAFPDTEDLKRPVPFYEEPEDRQPYDR